MVLGQRVCLRVTVLVCGVQEEHLELLSRAEAEEEERRLEKIRLVPRSHSPWIPITRSQWCWLTVATCRLRRSESGSRIWKR